MSTKIVRVSEKQKPPRAGMGRPAGVPNKVTRAFRETVNSVLSDNAENVSKWLNRVAERDPGRALVLLTKLAEFAAPKLYRQEARTEIIDAATQTIEEVASAQQAAVLEILRRKHSF